MKSFSIVTELTARAQVQEERLSRIKNDPSLPVQAMAACLSHAGLTAAALDRVVFYENPYAKLERVMTSTLGNAPRSLRQFPRAMAIRRLRRISSHREKRFRCRSSC